MANNKALWHIFLAVVVGVSMGAAQILFFWGLSMLSMLL